MLHDDQLVGKVDATAYRDTSVLQVHAVHEDAASTGSMTAAVDAELHAVARSLGLDRVRYE